MNRVFGSVAAILLLAGSAQAAAPPAEPYQVLRAGDKDLTCEQLATESNALNAKIMADQQAAQQRQANGQVGKQVAGAAAGGALRGGLRFGLARALPGMGAIAGMAVLTAADATADATGQAIANSGQGAGPAQHHARTAADESGPGPVQGKVLLSRLAVRPSA